MVAGITVAVEEIQECLTAVKESIVALETAVNDAGDDLELNEEQTHLMDECKNQLEKAATALYLTEQLARLLDSD